MHPLFHLISAVYGDTGMPTLREARTYIVWCWAWIHAWSLWY